MFSMPVLLIVEPSFPIFNMERRLPARTGEPAFQGQIGHHADLPPLNAVNDVKLPERIQPAPDQAPSESRSNVLRILSKCFAISVQILCDCVAIQRACLNQGLLVYSVDTNVPSDLPDLTWRGAGVVERGGLENRCTLVGTVGSNPTPSARYRSTSNCT